MKTLSEVVHERLQGKIRQGEATAQAAIGKLMSEAKIAKDYIAHVGSNRKDPTAHFQYDARVKMVLPGTNAMAIHTNAAGQLAERLAVPSAYLKMLIAGTAEQRELGTKILNDHTRWTGRSRVLVRAVGDEVRGVLSDQYRRLNGMEILSAFVKKAYESGAVLADGLCTDTKIFVEMLHPKPIIFPTPKNGEVAIAFGARLSTSDYGNGALDLRFFLMQAVCLNGMVRDSIMRQVHLGRKLPADLRFSEETYRLDTEATASAVRDLTADLFRREAIEHNLRQIQDASGVDVDITKELATLQRGRLYKSEAEAVEQLLLKNNPEDGLQGEATLWKLVQGITAHSREVEPERARELHEIAGALMNRVDIPM